jgi:hypothetical protein|tara:strand:+ start:306 stop:494 length:189 start_codon:yes stop_codon:yes gene_type:complete
MSYHGQPPSYLKTGIAVVNPLLRIEKKLERIQEVLDNIEDQGTLTATDLKTRLQKVIDDENW